MAQFIAQAGEVYLDELLDTLASFEGQPQSSIPAVPVELKVEEWAALPLQFDPLGQFHYRHFAALDL
jgi:hypothetical protein